MVSTLTDPLAVPRDTTARLEDEFLAAAVQAISRGERNAMPEPPAGNRWVERAVPHGVLMPVIVALRSAGLAVPPAATAYRTAGAVRSLALRQDLAIIAEALDAERLVWVIVKGPVLSEVVYQHKGTRECTDLDLLVAPAHLRQAVEVLRARGVQLLGVDWSQRTWATGAEVPMTAPFGTVVDLHWSLINRPGMRRNYSLDTALLLDRRVSREIHGLTVSTLDDLDLVLHVLLHSCLDGCGRLRALLDVQQCICWLASRGWVPSDLAQRATVRGLVSASWLVLSMTAELVSPTVSPWRNAMAGPTLWTRGIRRLSERKDGSALTNGATRRLVRYTSTSTASSVLGVAGYAGSRIVRLWRPDRTDVSADGPRDDPAFDRFLDTVERNARERAPHS